MSSSMSLEEKFEALIRQNGMLVNKIHKDTQQKQEAQAQNKYLRK